MKKSIDGEIIEMDFMNSRTLSTVGYNKEKKLLAIEFTRGPVYVYNEVPESIYEELMKSDVPDDVFFDKIKNGFVNKRVW